MQHEGDAGKWAAKQKTKTTQKGQSVKIERPLFWWRVEQLSQRGVTLSLLMQHRIALPISADLCKLSVKSKSYWRTFSSNSVPIRPTERYGMKFLINTFFSLSVGQACRGVWGRFGLKWQEERGLRQASYQPLHKESIYQPYKNQTAQQAVYNVERFRCAEGPFIPPMFYLTSSCSERIQYKSIIPFTWEEGNVLWFYASNLDLYWYSAAPHRHITPA